MADSRETDRMTTEVSGTSKDCSCTIDALKSRSCRWPLGDPKHVDFRFCGKKRRTGSPYCDEHHEGAFIKGDSIREIPA